MNRRSFFAVLAGALALGPKAWAKLRRKPQSVSGVDVASEYQLGSEPIRVPS
jgi:hypothetical protein